MIKKASIRKGEMMLLLGLTVILTACTPKKDAIDTLQSSVSTSFVDEQMKNLPEGEIVEEQCFNVMLDGWGDVAFTTIAPKAGSSRDVMFYLWKNEEAVYTFPEINQEGFEQVLAIAFEDYNMDGKKDVIAIIEREGNRKQAIVYLQENRDNPFYSEYSYMETYKIVQESDKGPEFYRDTLLEEFLQKQKLTDEIQMVKGSWSEYLNYVDSLYGETLSVQEEESLPGTFPLEFLFSSGAGGWGTFLILNADGSFEGEYTDSNMGEWEEEYPNGTVYISKFNGKFDTIVQVNDTVYSMTLRELTIQDEDGKEWIEDGIRYVASQPYGLENGKDFIFYTPGTPLEGLSEEFLMWGLGRYSQGKETLETLSCYGLYNSEQGYGFFTRE